MGASKKVTIRKFLVFLFGLAVLSLARPDAVLFPIGLTLALVGEIFRVWGCGHLVKNRDVIMSGPFAYVKNPLYVGTFLIATGFCIQASNPAEPSRYILYAVLPGFWAVFFFYYLPMKVQVEGDRLRRRFGEKFDEYDRNVPEFFPRLTPYGGSKVRWKAALVGENSEYGILFAIVAGSAVISSKFFAFSESYDLWKLF